MVMEIPVDIEAIQFRIEVNVKSFELEFLLKMSAAPKIVYP